MIIAKLDLRLVAEKEAGLAADLLAHPGMARSRAAACKTSTHVDDKPLLSDINWEAVSVVKAKRIADEERIEAERKRGGSRE